MAILTCLVLHRGERLATANDLGIAARTLTNKLKLYRAQGVRVPPPPDPRSTGRKSWSKNPRSARRRRSSTEG